uniref:NS4B protein n=1 Tax=Middle East respiratory syndrome-related coronavirus TaxID=1335626 RepID=A0A2D0Y3U6_MERS|nr:NS4B protein [Middle East respiratory syndrome-related coronavirus]
MEESLMDVPSTSGTQVYSRKARKRSHSPTKKLRYVKRRFSLLRPEDLSVIVQPTHYVRVTFSDPNMWYLRSGHHLHSVHNWLKPYGGQPVSEYHITLALLNLTDEDLARDFSPIALFLRNVRFELHEFALLRKTLVLNASEIYCANIHRFKPVYRVNTAIPTIKDWLLVQGFSLYHSGLPLHMSISKLHTLDDVTRNYIITMPCFRTYPQQMFVTPLAVDVVSIRSSNQGNKQIVHSHPILHHSGF